MGTCRMLETYRRQKEAEGLKYLHKQHIQHRAEDEGEEVHHRDKAWKRQRKARLLRDRMWEGTPLSASKTKTRGPPYTTQDSTPASSASSETGEWPSPTRATATPQEINGMDAPSSASLNSDSPSQHYDEDIPASSASEADTSKTREATEEEDVRS